MGRLALEVADIFRAHGPAWRDAQHDHLSLGQLKVMSAIEQCRSATLGGHVLCCPACEHQDIAYNSCRNRHCPKCQASAAKRWLEARQADLLPASITMWCLPCPRRSALSLTPTRPSSTVCCLRSPPRRYARLPQTRNIWGAQIGATLVLHTWGSALTHHPHVHGIVPGGGLSLTSVRDKRKWAGFCKIRKNINFCSTL
jgi:hypothetical protein